MDVPCSSGSQKGNNIKNGSLSFSQLVANGPQTEPDKSYPHSQQPICLRTIFKKFSRKFLVEEHKNFFLLDRYPLQDYRMSQHHNMKHNHYQSLKFINSTRSEEEEKKMVLLCNCTLQRIAICVTYEML
jgi:hypothetical protein